MKSKSLFPLLLGLVISLGYAVHAAEPPKPGDAPAAGNPEAKAQADYEAAEKAARAAEADVVPLRAAMQKADAAYATASRAANAKRQQATDAKNLAGESGIKELKQAEENVPAAEKALAEATEAKPRAEQTLADAKAAAQPLQQAFEAADKAAKEAEIAAKQAADAANKVEDEAKRAVARAAAQRRAADAAKTALALAERNEQHAQSQLATATQKLAELEKPKQAADQALAAAKAPYQAASAAYQAAEQAATAAEADAKIVSGAEKQQAVADAAAKRKAADAAQAALKQARTREQQAQEQVAAAAKNKADAATQKKAAEALAAVRKQTSTVATAAQAAEQAARAAEAYAKVATVRAARSPEQKQQAIALAATKRKAAEAAKAALAPLQAAFENAQNVANTVGQPYGRVAGQKQLAESTLESLKKQIDTATNAVEATEAAAAQAAKVAEEKKAPAAVVSAKRKAIADALAAIAQAQQVEQQVLTRINAANKAIGEATTQKKPLDVAAEAANKEIAAATTALNAAEQAAQAAGAKVKEALKAPAKSADEKKKLAEDAAAKRKAADAAKSALNQVQQKAKPVLAKAATAAQKLAGAEAEKKAAETALAAARNQIAAATAAHEAARVAGKEVVPLEDAARQAAADAAAKRKAAVAAKAALNPVQQKLDQAAVQFNTAVQKLNQAEARKKSADESLESLKKRIASAKQTHVADEQAAKDAEAAAAPLKAEADKTRAAYAAATKLADEKRAAAEQAKTVLYRLVAARQVAALMECQTPPKPVNRVDELVFAKLKVLGIQPVLCSDSVFIRRVYLDVTGTLPTADEARAFIQSQDPNKRIALIDRLLEQTAHADYWAMKWSDILRVKAEFPVKVWPNAAQAYHRWIWESIVQNKPYDQFARELLTSSGSNFRVGPVNFYRAIQDRTPEGIASVVGLALMGSRLHLWPEDRRAGMAAFFAQVGYKPTSEWKEEIVFWDPLNSVAVANSTAPGVDAIAKAVTATNQIAQALPKPLAENGPLTAVFPDGTKITIPPNRDPREAFAEWLIRPENPWFARAIANRTWAWIMGRGIVHEPDDLRDNNPPCNPELLDYLTKELVASRYNLKHLKRLIFTSTAYQFSSIPRFKGPEAKANFASYTLRRVEAEVLIDSVNRITGSTDLYTSAVPEPFSYIPSDMSAVALADGSITSSFLTLFGRSSRSTGMESERVSELASPQWLHMLNSAKIQAKLQNGPKLSALISAGGKPNEIAERLYLTILSRLPTAADVKAVEDYSKMGAARGRDAWIDLAWALINSPEFLLRH